MLRISPSANTHYKGDPQGVKQYGLVAEEVEPLYPELVSHGDDGKVQGVRYSMLIPMLLNELQKQARDRQRQAMRLERLEERIAALGRDRRSGAESASAIFTDR